MQKPIYKSASKKVLASAYNLSTYTFRRWLKPISHELGEYVARSYNPKQVEKIVELLGEPEYIHLIRA